MNQNSAEFTYLKNKFPTISDAKIEEILLLIFLFRTMTNMGRVAQLV